MSKYTFLEFFAGGGMARAGLGSAWQCLFANDVDPAKAASYRANWGGDSLLVADVKRLYSPGLPASSDMAWASFPCQDLSQAGSGAGLTGRRSGTFWSFWQLMNEMNASRKGPRVVVLENVPGVVSSHEGRDFSAICGALIDGGYQVGAILVNASLFLPQSRLRLFFIAVRNDLEVPASFRSNVPMNEWHNQSLRSAVSKLSPEIMKHWIWWDLPNPIFRTSNLSDLIFNDKNTVKWNSAAETSELLSLMSEAHLAKVTAAIQSNARKIGTIYKRRRSDGKGGRIQRAEVRFDDLAGCLRTPLGGSSRQTLIIIDGNSVKTRILHPREAARLMGLSDSYVIPDNYYEASHLIGDGVAVPVVRYIAEKILEPIIDHNRFDKMNQIGSMLPALNVNRPREGLAVPFDS